MVGTCIIKYLIVGIFILNQCNVLILHSEFGQPNKFRKAFAQIVYYVYVYITFHGITEYVKKTKNKLKVPLFFTHIQTGVSQHNTMHYICSCSQVIKHM